MLQLPYEYGLATFKPSCNDPLVYINDTFGFSFKNENFLATEFKIKFKKRRNGNFFKCSAEVGFTVFSSIKGDFSVDVFGLDIDGNADGLLESINVKEKDRFIVRNHPLACFNFKLKEDVVGDIEVTELKANDESILSSLINTIKLKHDDNLIKFLNPIHLNPEQINIYGDLFLNASVVVLDDFLNENSLEKLIETIQVEDWPTIGPADYRNFKINNYKQKHKNNNHNNTIDLDVESFMMSSKEFLQWISNLTGLPVLHPASPFYTRCLQSAGDYQILHGNYSEPLGLDLIYTFYPKKDYKEWPESWCGRIHYLNDAGEELLQINPKMNSLTIVFRTEGSVRFTENVKSFPDIPLLQIMGIYTVA